MTGPGNGHEASEAYGGAGDLFSRLARNPGCARLAAIILYDSRSPREYKEVAAIVLDRVIIDYPEGGIEFGCQRCRAGHLITYPQDATAPPTFAYLDEDHDPDPPRCAAEI